MKREDVEALLAVSVAGNDEWADVVQRKLTRRITRELCRAWLAVQDSPVVCAGKSAVMGEGWQIYGLDGDNIASLPFEDGKRVRIVAEGEA